MLEFQSYIINPEGIACVSDEGFVASGGEYDDDMCRLVIGTAPSFFLYGYHLTFGVECSVGFIEAHV